jgi:ArsR family transcriptional regulator, arsenate/arsenite/antimonite-responsive transcriptional repressor
MNELPMVSPLPVHVLETYESKFKALADAKRLRIMNLLVQKGKTCVCDLVEMVDMPQSKLSYHLKILLDQDLIKVEQHGKWNYYELNQVEVNRLLSDELCCLFLLNSKDNECC